MEIVYLAKRWRVDKFRDCPVELLFHLEQCLRLPVREALNLQDQPDFFETLKNHAKKDLECPFPSDRTHPITIYEDAAYKYRKSFCDLEVPTCLFEPTCPGGVVDMIKKGDVQGLEKRLQQGLHPDGYSIAGIPFLCLAVVHMQVECIDLLLRYTTSPSPRGYWFAAGPLDYVMPAALSYSCRDHKAIIRTLVNVGSFFSYTNVLDSIFLYDDINLLKRVMDEPPGLFAEWPHSGFEFIFHRLAWHGKGCDEIIDLINSRKPDAAHQISAMGHTPLHYAVENKNDVNMVRKLLRLPINLSALDKNEVSALTKAVIDNYVEAVNAMISHPDINLLQLHEVLDFNKTPLGQAMTQRNQTLFIMLLSDPRMCLTERARDAALVHARKVGLDDYFIEQISTLQV
ncbi:ankyrin [Aspergillus neoniger CBS 115656]|uniref:Ankyrin n=1 Tax=Aspergillus neoniger (strain CBS 115656) TaxID=1448310 RepID=A0A318YT27_ASPNB|nr:ankyrin [Aspergillus neoniger CBS 115656]PYH35200.1 ankyrin [Aspergillus neoniger CBS 115656]